MTGSSGLQGLVKINPPLRRLVNFSVDGVVGACYLAYERLPYLYFHCGLLGHLIKQCPAIPQCVDTREKCVYGLWITISSEKSWLEFKVVDGVDDVVSRMLAWDSGDGGGSRLREEAMGDGFQPLKFRRVLSQNYFLHLWRSEYSKW
ncbi:hypothetical protein LIER_16639 [Lithospermum erythrorhizon]|uniref:CCHC-type domain-containing protein n=1 Tax=Lithospermum erythrorhizon TaxID=34254 RepID=A0AAV3QAJ8_LITER